MSQAARKSNEAHRTGRKRPEWSRGRTLSLSARGDTTVSHGPLQRLLEDALIEANCARAEASVQTEGKVLNTAADATNAVVADKTGDHLAHCPRALPQLQTKGPCPDSRVLRSASHSGLSFGSSNG
jgi:hypothetical protein